MSPPKTIQDEISELEARLNELRKEREMEQRRTKVLAKLKDTIASSLKAEGLTVEDLLEAYSEDIARMGGKRGGRAAPKTTRRKSAKSTKTRVRIDGVGEFMIASRGKVPDAVKAFMDAKGLDRTGLIDKYGA